MHYGGDGELPLEMLFQVWRPGKRSENTRRDLGFIPLKEDRNNCESRQSDYTLGAMVTAFTTGLELNGQIGYKPVAVRPLITLHHGGSDRHNLPVLDVTQPPNHLVNKLDLLEIARRNALKRLGDIIWQNPTILPFIMLEAPGNTTYYAARLLGFRLCESGIVPIVKGHGDAVGKIPRNLYLHKSPLATRSTTSIFPNR